MNSNLIITIGRQYGSGGREIGEKLAHSLGIGFYNNELITLAAKKSGMAHNVIGEADEKATNPYLFQTVHEGNYHVLRGRPTSEVLFALQSHEIRRLAKREECVFVGRCADFVLREQDVRLLRVFISAPEEHRVARKMEQERLSHNQAVQLVRKMDKQRKKYYESYTGQVWGAPQFHDLCLDTSRFSIPECVELIVTKFLTL